MALSIKGVSKVYEGGMKETLHDISLEIADGEFICIVGPSGCGKSTLLNIIAGLEPATSGSVLLDGNPVTGPGADRAVMFQEAALFPWLNVRKNVNFGMKLAGIPKEERLRRADFYLKLVQLHDFEDYPVHQLSGGMKQRAALARALTMDSRILLMDEPFSALDKQTINLLREELLQIWIKTGKTIFYVTHSVEEAVYFADRVIVISEPPGTIKQIYDIRMERPREIDSPEFLKLRKNILNQVKREVVKIAEKEYDKG